MDTKEYNHLDIEAKWQIIWVENKTFSPDLDQAQKPFYNLMMFPYPSAEGMHVGNMYAQTGSDIYGRFKRMQGYDVFQPFGLDGFGIHSENYALKIGKHPMDQAKVSERNFYRQTHATGSAMDWERTVETYDPDYYRWTQWLFVQMFKKGLAYRKKALVNYCPSCKTVLSDEQVIKGLCERCSSQVEKKDLEQWFFKITNYAERLLNNIKSLNWTEKVKIAQENWIGRSEGATITFSISNSDLSLDVFTTRPDTLYGATFLVISPEHPIIASLLNSEFKIKNLKFKEIEEYVNKSKAKTEEERAGEDKEKSGIFSGVYAINPANSKQIPIWIADYVLMSYGTGAIMAVPAHDSRDYAFAKKYQLPIVQVIENMDDPASSDPSQGPYIGEGRVINSEGWDDYYVPAAMGKIIEDLKKQKLGKKTVNYHLRDWLISRQRYWGAPIPMIFCQACYDKGSSYFTTEEAQKNLATSNFKSQILSSTASSAGWYPVPEDELPVLLPRIDDYKPLGTGRAPLASHPEFYKTHCPECGEEAIRETDVCDTFLDSAWYFFRYISTDKELTAFDIDRARKWLPITIYIGGAEHSVLHLLYSRFMTMFLHDLHMISFEEPFSRFFAHGLLIKEGAKMSKSKGNVIIPDEYIQKYGADTLRSYLMFLGPFSQGGDFYDTGIEGMNRFLKRVWKLLSQSLIENSQLKIENMSSARVMHKTIKKVTEEVEALRYNTAIASLMEWYNYLNATLKEHNEKLSLEEVSVFLKLLAPFAPHMTEELWQTLVSGKKADSKSSIVNRQFSSIHLSSWPEYDLKLLEEESITIIVQINGKLRGNLIVDRSKTSDQAHIEQAVQDDLSLQKYFVGKSVQKIVYVSGKVINFVLE